MKKLKKKMVVLVVGILLAGTSIVMLANRGTAYWEDDPDDHKMHFPQLPDTNGYDILCREDWPLADDFMCGESGPITDVHFWGSWYFNQVEIIEGFWIGIWSDNPGGGGPSHPEDLLWERCITDYHMVEQTPSIQGFYWPQYPDVIEENHDFWWQYNIDITEDHFWQEEGTIYWLSIRPIYYGETYWGWKNADIYGGYYPEPGVNYRDDAVWGTWDPTRGYNWLPDGPMPIEYPYGGPSMDLAFVITGTPCCNKDWDYWTDWPNIHLIPSGNVGIGTSTPSHPLDIVSTQSEMVKISGANYPQYVMESALGGAHEWSFFGAHTGWFVRDITNAANPFGVLNDAPHKSLWIQSSAVIVNILQNDYDFRVKSTSNANMLFVDASADAVGIGTSSPDETFEVEWISGSTDAEIGRGITDPDVTFIALRSPNGTKYYIYPNDSGTLVTTTTHP